jgi:hypothetical protein
MTAWWCWRRTRRSEAGSLSCRTGFQPVLLRSKCDSSGSPTRRTSGFPLGGLPFIRRHLIGRTAAKLSGQLAAATALAVSPPGGGEVAVSTSLLTQTVLHGHVAALGRLRQGGGVVWRCRNKAWRCRTRIWRSRFSSPVYLRCSGSDAAKAGQVGNLSYD